MRIYGSILYAALILNRYASVHIDLIRPIIRGLEGIGMYRWPWVVGGGHY
jgi:hypothetical protein